MDNKFLSFEIKKDSVYPSHKIEIAEWLCKTKDIDKLHTEVEIKIETEKAYCLNLVDYDEPCWVPKSQCEIVAVKPKKTKMQLGDYETVTADKDLSFLTFSK